MDAIYVFLIRNNEWIYIVCAFGLFWYVSQLWRARRILRHAMFGLEKETGTRMRNNALTFIAIFMGIVGVVYYVNAEIAPEIPQEQLRPPTPTADIFATPLASPTPLGSPEVARPSPTLALVPTVTLPGQALPPAAPDSSDAANEALATVTPQPSVTAEGETVNDSPLLATPVVGCTELINITQPADGAAVSGAVSFVGTADTNDFRYYTLEASGPETEGQWASLLPRLGDQPVRNGFLGSVPLGTWEPGAYLIRLTVVDTADTPAGSCVIQVVLQNEG